MFNSPFTEDNKTKKKFIKKVKINKKRRKN